MKNNFPKIVFFIIFLALIFYSSAWYLTNSRNIPNLEKEFHLDALRGDIVSADGYTLVSSRNIYRAEIDLRSIDKDKLDYFLKLFQIYAFLDDKQIAKIKARLQNALHKKRGFNFVLSNELSAKSASYLQELSRKLYYSGFFKPFKNANGKTETRGLSIAVQERKREFLKGDILTPILGYSQVSLVGNIFYNTPKKGLEKSYDECLMPRARYEISGFKDIGGNIIINSNSFKSSAKNGCQLRLNINLKLQKGLENIASNLNEKFGSDQIIIGVLNAKDASVLALATSKRYDPYNRKKDLSYLNADAVEFEFEPGSVMKPIAFANLLRHSKVNPFEWINTHNGVMYVGKERIKDTHPMPQLIAEDLIVHSSNIGMYEISKRLSVPSFLKGYYDFNFFKKTGIDLPYEKNGYLNTSRQIYEVEKNVMSYGYGFRATFIQMLAAYNVFNNRGIWLSPKIAKSYSYDGGEPIELYEQEPRVVLPLEVNKQINRILIKTANQKSLAKFWPEGITVGGKTGTARDNTQKGKYISSYFALASDASAKFTIGVLVIHPNKEKSGYFASKNAVPTAALTINRLIEDGFLKPNYSNLSDF